MGRKQKKRAAGGQLLDKGIAAAALGLGMLLVPSFLGTSPLLRPIAQGLRTPAWIALGLGLTLVALHFLLSKASGKPTLVLVEKAAPQEDAFRHEPAVAPLFHGTNVVRLDTDLATRPVPSRRTQWGEGVFDDIEWRRFEAVCERLFAQAGFRTSSQSHGADGGVDIWLHSRNAEGPVAVVQCKHWSGKSVGVKELREFFGVMASKSMKRGTYATSSSFTEAAKEFARDNGIHLLDRAGLLALVAKRTPDQQQALLEVAYEGEYWRPTCASCGTKMVERVAAKEKSRFWGCSNFPRCRTRLPMRA